MAFIESSQWHEGMAEEVFSFRDHLTQLTECSHELFVEHCCGSFVVCSVISTFLINIIWSFIVSRGLNMISDHVWFIVFVVVSNIDSDQPQYWSQHPDHLDVAGDMQLRSCNVNVMRKAGSLNELIGAIWCQFNSIRMVVPRYRYLIFLGVIW